MAGLNVGDVAPSFSGVNEKGDKISLDDFKGRKLILFFYPKDDTPGCTAAACTLRDSFDILRERGFEMLGVSPDNSNKHTKFIEKHNFPFSLLADTDKEVLQQYEAWGEKSMFGKKYMGVKRTTYVIDEEGKIEKVFKKVKTKEHADQILQAYES
jgi:peroxiredoxin Q/BCP